MKIIGYIGEPATGKSTLMRSIMAGLGEGTLVKEGVVVYHLFPETQSIVLGIYDGQVFSGTDRLSKAVGPKFRAWLTNLAANREYEDFTIYWEGERFSNAPSLEHMYATCPTTIYLLEADSETLEQRHKARDNQNETWLKGMKTRVRNLAEKFPVVRFPEPSGAVSPTLPGA
jgi:dephospho-CoA kinase